jgi:SAM-dependent methyltransferase
LTAETAVSQEEVIATLREQRRAWDERPAVRHLYEYWFSLIADRLSTGPGPTVEIGAGCGGFQDFMPSAIGTDIVPTPWADRAADAEQLPFAEGEVRNLVMVDVLHHIPRPVAALREAERVLMPGGRLVMVEPYCSPLSTFGYRRFHHEDLDFNADPAAPASQSSDDPFDANIALPTIIFFRRAEMLSQWTPGLSLVDRRRLAWLAYPLSGGFTGKPLLPDAGVEVAARVDRALAPVMARLGGYRCLVALEKSVDGARAARPGVRA